MKNNTKLVSFTNEQLSVDAMEKIFGGIKPFVKCSKCSCSQYKCAQIGEAICTCGHSYNDHTYADGTQTRNE